MVIGNQDPQPRESTLKRRLRDSDLDETCCDAPNSQKVVINEVVVRYRIENQGFELSLDPGDVDTVIWDPEAWRIYWLGQGTEPPVCIPFDARGPNYAGKDVRPGFALDFGVRGNVRYRIADQWYESEPCITFEIVYRYYSRKYLTHYEVRIPAHSQDDSANHEPPARVRSHLHDDNSLNSRYGGYSPSYVREGIHALFWRMDDCMAYRRGLLGAKRRLSPLLKVNPAGEYVDSRLGEPDPAPVPVHAGASDEHGTASETSGELAAQPDQDEVSKFELFRAVFPALPGRYNSVTGVPCKHFDNCDWSCTYDV